MTTSIVEITADNAARLGVDASKAGRVALVDGETTVLDRMPEALDEITHRRLDNLSWTIGEALPAGDGRRWLVVEDDE